MPPLPRWRGHVIHDVPMQAEPIWSIGERCVYISDGSSDWVATGDLVTGRTDTVRLPPRRPMEPSQVDVDRWAREWADMRRMGFARRGMENVRPTARAKWSNMVVDPDGFLWVEPWRPPSLEQEPLTALIVNPGTGALDSVRVPRFPDAFLPGGEFVALSSIGAAPVVGKYRVRNGSAAASPYAVDGR